MVPDRPEPEAIVRRWLEAVGEDPGRQGLADTPRRVAAAWRTMTSGYGQDPVELLRGAMFDVDANHMILVRDIEFYSLCEHHLLPFFGVCHIGYIPRGRVVGISKLARLTDLFARRLQIQERLTEQIATEVRNAVDAVGVGVVMECRHLCMMMRGVEKQNSVRVTSSVLGTFRGNPSTRAEFMNFVQPSLAR
jgi:GTP cyclohydrolase I